MQFERFLLIQQNCKSNMMVDPLGAPLQLRVKTIFISLNLAQVSLAAQGI
jgi:hypothetical protein